MSTTDPKITIVALLIANINTGTYDIKEDDGSINATMLVSFDLSIETVKEEFASNDVIISVSQGTGRTEWIGLDKLQEIIPITLDIYVIDKHTAGTVILTGTEVRYKAKDAISRMIKAKVVAPGGSLVRVIKVDDDDDDITDTRPFIFHSIIELEVILLR